MAELLLPGNRINYNTGLVYQESPFGKVGILTGVCDITTTTTLSFDLKQRSGQADKADTTIGTVPVGAYIFYMGIRVPSGLVATNSDRLKLAAAVTATGTQTFDASAATAYVATSAASSSTIASGQYRFGITPFSQSAAAERSAALGSAYTFKLYSDNGTNAAGSGVSVASGTAQIICQIKFLIANYADLPTFEQIAVRPARAT